jgi:hypothetical protein
MKLKALKAAFPHTIPVLLGYLFMGMAFGILLAAQGFAPANCSEAVRNSGARVVSHADEDAIAAVIAILDEMYQ